MLSIGLMSGTSMDGIDAALINTNGDAEIEARGCISIEYDQEFKLLLHIAQFCIKENQGNLEQAKQDYFSFGVKKYLKDELAILPVNIEKKLQVLQNYVQKKMEVEWPCTFDHVIEYSTKLHAEAVLKLLEKEQLTAEHIDVVGYHGQALYHQPNRGISIVLGDGQLLANLVKIVVINDFRRHDVASGGQGAPFAPLYHQALAIRDNKIPVAVVNCGGIANMTLIKDRFPENLIGFDTGPGNGLIDRFVRQRTSGKENIDYDGKYGKSGTVCHDTLDALRQKSIVKGEDSYLDILPPKSLDFGDLVLIDELSNLSIEDGCATLEAFTAETIVASLDLLKLNTFPKQWVLAGGGWNNPVILSELKNRLSKKIGSDVSIHKADEMGWNNQALEAQIFAYFAVRSLQGKPLSVPGTTGVPKPLSGGHGYLPETGASSVVMALIEKNPFVLSGYEKNVTCAKYTHSG